MNDSCLLTIDSKLVSFLAAEIAIPQTARSAASTSQNRLRQLLQNKSHSDSGFPRILSYVDNDFIQQPRLERLSSHVRAEDDHVALPSRVLGDPYRLLDINIYELARDTLDDRGLRGWIVRKTKNGPRKRPP